jgi:hypothetical protein
VKPRDTQPGRQLGERFARPLVRAPESGGRRVEQPVARGAPAAAAAEAVHLFGHPPRGGVELVERMLKAAGGVVLASGLLPERPGDVAFVAVPFELGGEPREARGDARSRRPWSVSSMIVPGAYGSKAMPRDYRHERHPPAALRPAHPPLTRGP